MKLQKAVKDETVFVALGSIILSVIMVIVFFVLHRVFPERVPMDLPVIIGAVGGCAVAIGNFFLMAVTVQKVAGIENYDQAYRSMQVSYRYRTFLQLIWCVLVCPYHGSWIHKPRGRNAAPALAQPLDQRQGDP